MPDIAEPILKMCLFLFSGDIRRVVHVSILFSSLLPAKPRLRQSTWFQIAIYFEKIKEHVKSFYLARQTTQNSNTLKDGGSCIELILNWRPFEVILTFVSMFIWNPLSKVKKMLLIGKTHINELFLQSKIKKMLVIWHLTSFMMAKMKYIQDVSLTKI